MKIPIFNLVDLKLCFVFFIIATSQSSTVIAQTISLSEQIPLKSRPSVNDETSILASKGETIRVISNTQNWIHLDYKGKKYFTEYGNIYETPGQKNNIISNTKDPACDYGMPYSGSSIFFERPLANLRHSTFLGTLFGTHEEYPC